MTVPQGDLGAHPRRGGHTGSVAEQPFDLNQARLHVMRLCADGRPHEAVHFAEAAKGHPFETEQLLAMAELDAGEQLADGAIVDRGIARFEALEDGLNGELFAYNRANGHLALWEIARKQLGVSQALTLHRNDLQCARDLFAAVGADETHDANTRAQALTNLANSLDTCGRHIDALNAYDEALAIQPRFGMALGNRGLTLLYRAADDPHYEYPLGCEAVAALDAALAVSDDVLAHGGTAALESFVSRRALVEGTPTHEHDRAPLPDSHLEWCRRHELFLHPSHPCITPTTEVLDAIRFRRMLVGIDEDSQARLRTLQDALNSLLQDYIAVRFLAWSSVEPNTPTRQHAAQVSQHASFHDSLRYVRWGVGTGLSVAALAAATNLLDKVASVTHLYLGTGRNPNHIYFRGFWLLAPKKKQPVQPDPVIAAELDAGNQGLLALCDLAGELERATPLNQLIARRHAATHRAVAVHDMVLHDIDDQGWLDRVSADDLSDALLAQLARARAALTYLADLITAREERNAPDDPLPELPFWPAETEDPEGW